MSTATPVLSGAGFRTDCWAIAPSPLVGDREPQLDRAGVARHAIAEHQIEDRSEGITGGAGPRGCPVRIDARGFDGHQEIEDTDDEDQGGVLEQADGGVDDVRDGYFQ